MHRKYIVFSFFENSDFDEKKIKETAYDKLEDIKPSVKDYIAVVHNIDLPGWRP